MREHINRPEIDRGEMFSLKLKVSSERARDAAFAENDEINKSTQLIKNPPTYKAGVHKFSESD